MSRKRSSPPAVVAAGASKRSYAAASIPDHSRNMLGQLFAAHTHLGRKTGDFVGLLKAAEIDVSESSLFAWRALAVKGQPVVSPVKAPGRKRVASAEELELLLGFVVNKCAEKLPVTRQNAQDFLFEYFGHDVAERTIGDYLRLIGVGVREMKLRTSGELHTDQELCDMYMAWIKRGRQEGLFNGLLASIDCTTTTHRNDRLMTYVPTGLKSPGSKRKTTSYTNNIVTFVQSDGVQVACMLFTYNMALWPGGPMGKKRKRQYDYLKRTADELGISLDRIVYIGTPPNERRTWASETSEMYTKFLNYHNPVTDVIFTDGGRAFGPVGKEGTIEKLDYKAVRYPAPIHQFLSPNDNKLHGIAKNKWRAMRPDLKDDVRSSLLLMKCIDDVAADTIKGFFADNLFLRPGPVRPRDVATVMHGPAHSKIAAYRTALAKYRHRVLGEPLPKVDHLVKIASDLDGAWWSPIL